MIASLVVHSPIMCFVAPSISLLLMSLEVKLSLCLSVSLLTKVMMEKMDKIQIFEQFKHSLI